MKAFDFSELTRSNIRSLQPYIAKDIPCKVKLDANESPYSVEDTTNILPEEVLKTLNRYPDPEAKRLKAAIAKAFRVTPEQIILGNGSDELIYYLILAFGGPVLYPVPTFSMYGIISQAVGEPHVAVPLDGEFDLDMKRMRAAITRHNPKLLFLSSPNNPTGNSFSNDRIGGIIERAKGIVVVDEAYQPFSTKGTLLHTHKSHANVAILRTLSKIGFASLRLGFLIADEALITEVNKVRLPYNVNTLTQAIAERVVTNGRDIRYHVKTIMSERKRVLKALGRMQGVAPFPSDANFVLFKVTDADAVFQRLLAEGVLVRNMSGVVQNTLRVTIGTPQENTLFLDALGKVTGELQ